MPIIFFNCSTSRRSSAGNAVPAFLGRKCRNIQSRQQSPLVFGQRPAFFKLYCHLIRIFNDTECKLRLLCHLKKPVALVTRIISSKFTPSTRQAKKRSVSSKRKSARRSNVFCQRLEPVFHGTQAPLPLKPALYVRVSSCLISESSVSLLRRLAIVLSPVKAAARLLLPPKGATYFAGLPLSYPQ